MIHAAVLSAITRMRTIAAHGPQAGCPLPRAARPLSGSGRGTGTLAVVAGPGSVGVGLRLSAVTVGEP